MFYALNCTWHVHQYDVDDVSTSKHTCTSITSNTEYHFTPSLQTVVYVIVYWNQHRRFMNWILSLAVFPSLLLLSGSRVCNWKVLIFGKERLGMWDIFWQFHGSHATCKQTAWRMRGLCCTTEENLSGKLILVYAFWHSSILNPASSAWGCSSIASFPGGILMRKTGSPAGTCSLGGNRSM